MKEKSLTMKKETKSIYEGKEAMPEKLESLQETIKPKQNISTQLDYLEFKKEYIDKIAWQIAVLKNKTQEKTEEILQDFNETINQELSPTERKKEYRALMDALKVEISLKMVEMLIKTFNRY